MIDYDKINEYIATMISKSGGCAQLTGVAFNDLFGQETGYIGKGFA